MEIEKIEKMRQKIQNIIGSNKGMSIWGALNSGLCKHSLLYKTIENLTYDNRKNIYLKQNIIYSIEEQYICDKYKHYKVIAKILDLEEFTEDEYFNHIKKYKPEIVDSEEFYDLIKDIIKLGVNSIGE